MGQPATGTGTANQVNPGIGTTGPGAKLHAESPDYPAIQIYNTASGGRNYRIGSTAIGSGHGGGNTSDRKLRNDMIIIATATMLSPLAVATYRAVCERIRSDRYDTG